MIPFKPITLSDKEAIDACLAGNTLQACDFCFTNLFAWQAKFKTTFAIAGSTLFVRYRDADQGLCYMTPVGKMPLKESLPLIMSDARDNNIPLIIKAVTEQLWAAISNDFPHAFRYALDRDSDEYIYLTQKLISLQGKKLQSKRNHINRFKAENPDWEYVELQTAAELAECSRMLDEWDGLNMSKAQESLRYDYIATRRMLDHFHALRLCGAAIRARGAVVAFTIGEPLTADTFVVHVEKAFGNVNGAYSIINRQFAQHQAAAYQYINREEDMGLDYLRQAKMSYHPDVLLQERILYGMEN